MSISQSPSPIDEVEQKLKAIAQKQNELVQNINAQTQEIQNLKQHILNLKTQNISTPSSTVEQSSNISPSAEHSESSFLQEQELKSIQPTQSQTPNSATQAPFSVQLQWEKIIGENLINKLGILITIIGVLIGVKYSIEHQLISPLTRILTGAIFGIGLLAFGFKLKSKYENYSAVLVSGAFCILYLITFSSYNFYHLLSQIPSFIFMLIITAGATWSAINLNRVIIAQLGLVGAYAIPFLLSENSGNTLILFSYILLINLGILVISYAKDWRSLYYSSFIFTWLTYFTWFGFKASLPQESAIAGTFLGLYFIVFYVMILIHRLNKEQEFQKHHFGILLTNSFLFFGLGYNLIEKLPNGNDYLGLWSVLNGLIHYLVHKRLSVYQKKHNTLYYLCLALSILFLSLSIPIQFQAAVVPLAWIAEALLLLWIARFKQIAFFEKMFLPVLIFATGGLLYVWFDQSFKGIRPEFTAILNLEFLNPVLFLGFLAAILWIQWTQKSPLTPSNKLELLWQKSIRLLPVSITITVAYFTGFIEICKYFQSVIYPLNQHNSSPQPLNFDIQDLWILNYSLGFWSILSIFTLYFTQKFKISTKSYKTSLLISGFLVLFLALQFSQGFEILLDHADWSLSALSSLILIILSILQIHSHKKHIQSFNLSPAYIQIYDFIFYASWLWLFSNMWIYSVHTWIHPIETQNEVAKPYAYALMMSLIWGVFSLALIIYGIYKNRAHLRLGALALLGMTLIKLFFHDISHLNTLFKTIIFLSLGILMLLISFLYNKYKYLIENSKSD